MKKVLLSIIALFLSCAEIKSQNTRFIDSVFASVEKTSLNYSDVYTDNYHKLDIYYPKGDVLLKRPVIFFNHGGAFYAGDKSSQDCIDFCTEFAKKGYVAVSLNYRLANPILFLTDKKVQLTTVLQSMADVKAALRFFVKDAKNTNQYRVDTTAFFVGGYSAGAVASLHTAWVKSETELDANLKDLLKNSIKTLEGDAGNNGHSNPIKAIYSMAGAIHQLNFISAGDVPVWLGHSKDDATVPYDCGPGLNNPLVVELCGPGKMVAALEASKVTFDTMILSSGGHGWPGLGNKGTQFKRAVKEIASFLYPMINNPNASNHYFDEQVITKVYPNPANNKLLVESTKLSANEEYNLCNAFGQSVRHGQIIENTERIDVSDLPRGVYYLKFSDSNRHAVPIILE